MPELPEVETIRRSLEPLLLGKVCAEPLALTPEVLVTEEKPLHLAGERVQALGRKGKYLLLDLEKHSLLIHLRMTGRLLYLEKSLFQPLWQAAQRQTAFCPRGEPGRPAADDAAGLAAYPCLRLLLSFDSGDGLIFCDQRRFGRIYVYPFQEYGQQPGFAALGPDALSEDLTEKAFLTALAAHPQQRIKSALLDQQIVAGIGNIYADESLFRAHIRPEALAGSLSQSRLRRLYKVIRSLLEEAVGLGGTSFRDYVNGLGQRGHFQLSLAVYQREGEPCPVCGRPIKKTTVAGRGTRYCPSCQRF